MVQDEWLQVDRKALRKQIAQRGKVFVVHELIQNAWDEKITEVSVILNMVPGSRTKASLTVLDDAPDGFEDITHAFTFYADSKKKGNAELRGRFNEGEKMVLALCDSAKIVSKNAAVEFLADGKRRSSKERTAIGSMFEAIIAMTPKELVEVEEAVNRLIVPKGISTYFNGKLLKSRESFRSFEIALPTKGVNADGEMINTIRKTVVNLYKPLEGEEPMVYELGIPVVELSGGEPYHADVQQKVPLNRERDNVPPKFLTELRVAILNHTYEALSEEEARTPWVAAALENENVTTEAIKEVIESRFGENAVSYDVRDGESNTRAAANGFVVVGGGSFSKPAWENIRKANVLVSAGKVFPTPQPYGTEGERAKLISPGDARWTDDLENFVAYVKDLHKTLIGRSIKVLIVERFNAEACYGQGEIHFNYNQLGKSFFAPESRFKQLSLLIHEFAHAYAPDHFSEKFHDACCEIGAKLALHLAKESEKEPAW
jgi:hypothetical protein